ncbi:MAG: hypothetical protein IPK73_25525 [Candidatus Obscuribacter sp.]|nr:hypothetical protein [Candidatus Obscuribacter sp.]MBK9277481.1 hypothetical protein [Candidatus Obscuribacter sp.]
MAVWKNGPPDSKEFQCLAFRFARKLRELGFQTPQYDHVYLYLIPELTHGEAAFLEGFANRKGPRAMACNLKVGVSPDQWALLNELERTEFMVHLISNALHFLAVEDSLDASLVGQVKDLMLKHGSDLEIVQMRKKKGSLEVAVSYTIEEDSKLYVSWHDVKTNQSGRKLVLLLIRSKDAPSLVRKVSISKEGITLIPGDSARDKAQRIDYIGLMEFPIHVPIQ